MLTTLLAPAFALLAGEPSACVAMQDLTAAQGVLEHVAFSKDEFETRQGAPAPDFDDCELLSGSPGGGGTCVFLCSGIPVFFPCGFL